MPRTNINYSNSTIYERYCKDPNIQDVYIGTTTNFKNRKHQHKINSLNINPNSSNLSRFINQNGGWNNWNMIFLEKFPCNYNLELKKRQYEILYNYYNSHPIS